METPERSSEDQPVKGLPQPALEAGEPLTEREPWPEGPLAAFWRDDPGSDPYNSTGRFARPKLK